MSQPTPSRYDDDCSDSDITTIGSESSQGYEDAPDADIGEETPAICLFCASTFPTAHEVFSHCTESHSFNWKQIAKTLGALHQD
jgi:hypothetical protein